MTEPTEPNEPTEPDPSGIPGTEGAAADASEVEHLTAIEIIEPGAEGGARTAAAGDDAGDRMFRPDGCYTFEAWSEGFAGFHEMAGALIGSQILTHAPATERYSPAARAIYDTADQVPALRWMIRPESVWLQRLAAIGMYTVPLAVAVRVELEMNRRHAATAAQAANDNDAAPEAEAAS